MISKRILVIGLCVLMLSYWPVASAQDSKDPSIEEKTHIHRLKNEKRAIYDAFTYVNRIPEEAGEGETPTQFAGRLFGRLANQEGRMLLKLPEGMTKDDYLAFKTFFRYEGEQAGNCNACHTPPNFNSDKTFVTTKGGEAKKAPILRNMADHDVEVAAVIKKKIEAAKAKKAGADDIDDAYAAMTITEKDVPGLVSFLELLNDTPEEGFRDLILNAEIVDTSDISIF